MFVVKLISYFQSTETPSLSCSSTHCISCPHYQVIDHGAGEIDLIVFDKVKDRNLYGLPRDYDDGVKEVCFKGGKDFHECFVENSSGKTVARYSCMLCSDDDQHAASIREV